MSSSGFLLRTSLDVPCPQLGESTVVLLAREESSAPWGILFISGGEGTSQTLSVPGGQGGAIVS